MQIEITKNVLTLMGNLKAGDVLNTDPKLAQTLLSIGAAKVREVDVPAVETATEVAAAAPEVPEPVSVEEEPAEKPKKAKKAAKAEPE